ncbi:MAG: hypothetical protein HY042_01105 [Spirochaetia bacterium]|nr:hypothetical protein [Spirochaetia bacterium]
MNQHLFLSAVILSAAIAGASCSKKSSAPSADVTARAQGSQEIAFSVVVPAGHHAYLDQGKDGNLMEIQFDFKGLGIAAKPKDAPKGVYDATVEATVLRGDSLFTFQVQDAKSLVGRKARVRTQICDEVKGLCYPVKYQDVEIQAGT